MTLRRSVVHAGLVVLFAVGSTGFVSSPAAAADDGDEDVAPQAAGSLSGYVGNDLNNSGVLDSGEPGAAGITGFLDYNGTGSKGVAEPGLSTDAYGNWNVPTAEEGTYDVVFPAANGHGLVSVEVTVTAGGPNTAPTAVIHYAGSVTGSVFNDVNAGASRDASEPGAGGVTVFTDTNDDNLLSPGERSAVTAANGSYTIASVPDGGNHVRAEIPAGATITVAATAITVASAVVTATQIGIKYGATVSGTVRQGGSGAANGYLEIDRNGDGVKERAISGADGTYAFASVPPGNHTVTPIKPEYYAITPTQRSFTVSGGGSVTEVDFDYTRDASGHGYWLTAADGGVFAFGDSQFHGSTGNIALNRPIVGSAVMSDGSGYWMVASDGGVFAFGDADFYGSTGAITLNSPIVGMAVTPDEQGYWLVAADGGVFAFGSAQFIGSLGATPLNQPIVAMAADPQGRGYYLVAADGGVFAFGAPFAGSAGATPLNSPIVGIAADPDRNGYWLVAADGGVFAYDARFLGSAGATALNQPIRSIAATPDGQGYYLVATDGGVFTFPSANQFDPLEYYGSTGNIALNQPIVAVTTF